MVRALLVYTNVVKEPWTPLGLMYIASYARAKGINVKIVDSKHDDIFEELKTFNPHFVGLGGMTIMSPYIIQMAKAIRHGFPEITIIFGGVHFTAMPQDALDYADIIIKGEGEKTFTDVCLGKPLRRIPGIMYKERNEWIDNGAWELIYDLDELPLPAYDMIKLSRYKDELVTGERAISIMTGRGCPYNCLFCASPFLWKRKCRYHSIDYIMKYIRYLVKNYNLSCLRIMDDTFTVDEKRIYAFCDAIEAEGLKLKMTCLTNVHNASLDLFKRMKQVGFEIVAFGLESVDPTVLKAIHKTNTEANMTQAVRWAHEAGLETELLFMVGNICETKQSLEDSVAFSKKLYSKKCYFQYASPFPGSQFYDVAEQFGKVKDRDWASWDHKHIHYVPNGLDEDTMAWAVREGTHD